jgi:Flp pilus assembly pilin Flp
MGFKAAFPALRPREPRISVCVPARLRLGAQWSDARILNVSSRGLLIHARGPAERGSYVELRRGDQLIIGRVMWRSGSLAGLRAQDRVPVEAIVSSGAKRFTVVPGLGRPVPERRSSRRQHDRSRMRARLLEFTSVALIAATLSIAVLSMVAEAVAEPFSKVSTALNGQAALSTDSR